MCIYITQVELANLLGLDFEDSRLWHAFEAAGVQRKPISVIEDDGGIEYQDIGLSIMFKRKPESPLKNGDGIESFKVVAFHLRRQNYEGYSEYGGRLDGDVQFRDTQKQVESKLGKPFQQGGGGVSKVLAGRRVPNWLKYKVATHFVHYQFDEFEKLEMVTISEK